jgi:hypothetical protein
MGNRAGEWVGVKLGKILARMIHTFLTVSCAFAVGIGAVCRYPWA